MRALIGKMRRTAGCVLVAAAVSVLLSAPASAESAGAATDPQQTVSAVAADGQQATDPAAAVGQQAADSAAASGQEAADPAAVGSQQAADPAAAGSQQAADPAAASGQQTADSAAAAEQQAVAEPPVTEAPFDARELLQLSKNSAEFWADCPTRDVELLTPNPFSRPQDALDTVNNIVIHYVGNAGSSAMDNRNYFESLKDSQERSASSHFVIGLDGEIVQCVPLSEVAYATKQRNFDTISIECCHPEADGRFNEYTYWSLVELSAWLCKKFHLDPQQILRHYDVTGKLCPLYYVEHPEEWQTLKDTIEKRLNELNAVSGANPS